MNKPVESILELIGKTPMLKLKRISKDIPAEIWAKVEFLNPSGSVKDRIALKMIEDAEKEGRINKNTVIIEPTSGNTGVSLAMVCALKGYKMIAVMPDCVSKERKTIIELLGGKAEFIRCIDKEKGLTKEDVEKVLARAEDLAKKFRNAFIPNQFKNKSNIKAHSELTAIEILEQTGGKFNAFVAACGTGGTFSGVAKVLKQKCPKVKRIVVEPAASAVMSGCEAGYHKIQGIGEGFIPENMYVKLADKVAKVTDEEAISTAHRLWREEGVMVGISGGANVFASLKTGKNMKKGDVVVTILPDSGMRYLSIDNFQKISLP